MLADWKVPFRALVDTTPDGILVCDHRGVLVLVNAEAERMFGYARDELVGATIDVLVPDAARAAHHRNISAYTATPRVRLLGSSHLALHGRRKDASEFPVEISLSPYESERGLLVIAGVRDITERKQLEAELTRAPEAAEAASAAKSEFLSSVSHELRTPLNAILGFAQLLADDPKRPLDARQADRIDHVIRGGEHLLRLVDDVLDLARIEDGRLAVTLEPVDAADVVTAVARTLEPIARRAGIAIHVTAGDELPAVSADRTRLLQILMNLGSNAIKYGRPHGHVTLRTELRDAVLRIVVEDDGIGIAEDQLAKIFEPFQRAGQETGPIEGTGIGLTISRRLAELMHATIGVTSQRGAGSAFWLDVPRLHEPAARPARAHAIASSPLAAGPARHVVLYIEDNPASTALMRDLVEQLAAIALLTAPSGELGLELARARVPDLIVMDIHLPGMTGLETTEALRRDEATRAIPIIGLSAAAFSEDAQRARAAGFVAYLDKPVVLTELARVLEDVLLA